MYNGLVIRTRRCGFSLLLAAAVGIGRAHHELPRRDQHELHANQVGHFYRHAEILGPGLLMLFGFLGIERGDGGGWNARQPFAIGIQTTSDGRKAIGGLSIRTCNGR